MVLKSELSGAAATAIESTDASCRSYYLGFLGVLIGCFLPNKVLAYALPAAFVVWFAHSGHASELRHRLTIVGYGILVGGLFYALIAPEFIIVNYVLAILTYSAFVPLIVIDSRRLASRNLLRAMLIASVYMVAVQGAIGIIQAGYGAIQSGSFGAGNGDRVEGTLHLALDSVGGFGNPIFAANMALMLLACMSVPEIFAGRRRIALVLGTTSLVLASVIHVLAFLITAVLAAFVVTRIRKPRDPMKRSGRRRVAIMLAFAILLGYEALPDDIAGGGAIVENAIDLDALAVPRAILIYRVFMELPGDAPLQPYVGLGPGQFSSRASLIASGLYLGGPDSKRGVPFLEPATTRLATEYCSSLLETFADSLDSMGSTHQPFCSWLSIYTELGLLGVIAVGWLVVRMLVRIRAAIRARPERQLEGWLCAAAMLFILFLGLQENYWEVPQAILIGLLLLKVMYANLMFGDDEIPA